MILDLDNLSPEGDPRLECDVCIVGGGAVGLAMATRLADAGVRVLVLEGGGTRLEQASQELQRGDESVGHPFVYLDSRYRVLGGTTMFWGGQVYPFDSFVTGARPWLGYEAWLVPDKEMQYWFDCAYRLIGLGDAVLSDSEVWGAAGYSAPDFGPDLEVAVTRWVKTRNFAHLFATQLRSGPRLNVLTHANVTALRLDASGRRVVAAVARTLGGRQVEINSPRFVLANGTLEITRLLLHPLADGTSAPWSESPWVGVPLMDHLDCIAADVHVLDRDRFHDLFDNIFLDGIKYYPKLRLARATQEREGLVDIAAQFHYRTQLSEALEYLKMLVRSVREGAGGVSLSELPGHLGAFARYAWPLALRYIRDGRSYKQKDARVSLGLYAEQLPAEGSRITLGTQRDAIGMRKLRVDWQIDGRELHSMRRFTQIIAAELERQGLARVTIDPALEAGDPVFREKVHDAVHHMGTARMASDRSQGVVDSNLKVFDVENLFIAGAATFPNMGFANPTFTAIALALRLADHLSGSVAR